MGLGCDSEFEIVVRMRNEGGKAGEWVQGVCSPSSDFQEVECGKSRTSCDFETGCRGVE